ncbi:MAG TPA: UpxY family transcription antiterminator [Caldithrix abyssi]|uniref:UpxY family transcription antiterminator n=1 Tax=Caldithrix abyssi TaxID=187145 RepID=A0A7V4TZV4_CALAY|nr:UpxY family transcription antiterminator [Caldithrix abyssi]
MTDRKLQWYAVYTRPRNEKKVYELLTEKRVETFLPLVRRTRQWKDRKKKVDMPLFNSYLFVKIDYKDRFPVLQTHGVVKIITFNGVPAVVPEWQIESLRRMIAHPDRIQLENYMRPGEQVKVISGPFEGMQGTIKHLRGEDRLVISIDGILQSVSVDIDLADIKKL